MYYIYRGTGANAIFPLLGHRAFGWDFIATEKCKNSYKIAKKNIKKNLLESWGKRGEKTIFTCLIGIKSHMEILKTFLSNNFTQVFIQESTLYQGKTLRLVLAWEFKR